MKNVQFMQYLAAYNLNADVNFIIDKSKEDNQLQIASDSADVFKQTKLYITIGTKKAKKK
jgi:hypothetical protein